VSYKEETGEKRPKVSVESCELEGIVRGSQKRRVKKKNAMCLSAVGEVMENHGQQTIPVGGEMEEKENGREDSWGVAILRRTNQQMGGGLKI